MEVLLIAPNSVDIWLRHQHLTQFVNEKPDIAWLEVHAENFLSQGKYTYQLDKIAQYYPLSLHGVGLSLGSSDKLNQNHLNQLKHAINRYKPKLFSEHLSWRSVNGQYFNDLLPNFNDLLPIPYTKESLAHFVDKVRQTQDYLGRQILLLICNLVNLKCMSGIFMPNCPT